MAKATRALVIGAILLSGCSKLLGISDPSNRDATPGDGGPDAEVDSHIDAPPACTTPSMLTPEMSFEVGATGTGLAVAELNRLVPTGRDVAIAVGDGIQIMTGDGTGAFTLGTKITSMPANALVISNWDQALGTPPDADDDLMVWQSDGTTIAGIRQDSQVTPPSGFLLPQPVAPPGTFTNVKSAASGLIDTGMRPDLVVSDATTSRAYISSGLDLGAFNAGPSIPGVVAGDRVLLLRNIDDEGQDDVVFVNGGAVKLALNSGSAFATTTMIASGANARSIGFGMFTGRLVGDNKLDLMVGTPAGGRLFKQTSPGTFEEVPGMIPEIGGTKMQVLDVNGDGTDDVVVDNRIILQCPGALLGEAAKFTQVEGVNSAGPSVMVDINKNGKPDHLRLEGTALKVRLQ